MKISIVFLFSLFFTLSALARVVSPSSVEVQFQYEAEFRTKNAGSPKDLALDHAWYLFGYMQNEHIVKEFDLNPRIFGIGAPRWTPNVEFATSRMKSGVRTVQYRMSGKLLLNKAVARSLIRRGEWAITLPYEVDAFYDENCTDPNYRQPESFWYFYNPFRPGCEALREEPLARPVMIKIKAAPSVNEATPVGLAALRGDNGNGNLFHIMSVSGFDENSREREDSGRLAYEAINEWLRNQGFTDTFIQRYENRPIHQFDKKFRRPDGSEVHVRITRLLAESDLFRGRTVTFAKFFADAIRKSDVVMYEGHSGLGVNLTVADVEARAGGPVDFDPNKRQVFWFEACSSYSYYLPLFEGRKNPGTLSVLSNGLSSLFGYEVFTSKHFYRHLLDFSREDTTWLEMLSDMEKPLRGNTFMLNVDLN